MAQNDSQKAEFISAAQTLARIGAAMIWDLVYRPARAAVVIDAEPSRPKLCVSRKEAADMLDVSPATIDNLVKTQKLRKVEELGRRPKYPVEDIEALLKKRKE